MSAELLDALSSAFRTGYSVGREAGWWFGFQTGLPAGVMLMSLIYLAGYGYEHVYKKWKSEAKLRAARRDFKQFEKDQA